MALKFVHNVEEAFDFIRDEIKEKDKVCEELKASRGILQKFEGIDEESLAIYNKYNFSADKQFKYCNSIESIEQKRSEILLHLMTSIDSLREIQERNKAVLENNKAVVDQIKSFMRHFGVEEKYSIDDPKSRARYPKRITVSAGYIQDLSRAGFFDYCPIRNWITKFESLIQIYKDTSNKLIEELKKVEIEQIIKKNAEELEKLVAILKVKYNLDFKLNAQDVLSHILKQNKYLDLARAMYLTRNDWSMGFYRVDDSLGRFKIETDEDQKIFDSVNYPADENDGRYFRDCEYNYDILFQKVQEQSSDLYNDYINLTEYLGD